MFQGYIKSHKYVVVKEILCFPIKIHLVINPNNGTNEIPKSRRIFKKKDLTSYNPVVLW